MLRKILLATVLALGVSGAAEAQSTVALASRTFGPATVDANGESLTLPDVRGVQTVGIQTVGTFSGTLELQCTVDGTNYKQVDVTPVSSQTPAASMTTENVFTASVGGCTAARVISTAWTSGSVVVMARGTFAGGGAGGGGGGAASDVTSNGANISTETTLSTLSTKFGTAAAAADATANPTLGGVAAYLMAYNGTTWDRVRSGDPCAGGTTTPVAFSFSTATTTQLIAASSGNYARICSINIVVAGADNVALVEDDTSACASPTAGMAGGTTAGTGWNFAANGGLTLGNGAGTVIKTAATNRYVCLISSAAVQASGSITYALSTY